MLSCIYIIICKIVTSKQHTFALYMYNMYIFHVYYLSQFLGSMCSQVKL